MEIVFIVVMGLIIGILLTIVFNGFKSNNKNYIKKNTGKKGKLK